MTEIGTVVAVELGGEAKAMRDLMSSFMSPNTRCKIVTNFDRTIWIVAWTVRGANATNWFRQRQPRVRKDKYGVWNVCGDGWAVNPGV